MLDFTPVWNKEITLGQMTADLIPDDLRGLTNEMIDALFGLIADCVDADVTFQPVDPATGEQGWTLAHVIAHTTAGGEEAAFLAAEMARGVPEHGRSRYEVPWETITTIAQCRRRLEESRRMRLASLNMWPDQPHLDNTYVPREGAEPINAVVRFVNGLRHDDDHLGQIADVVAQATADRS
jgi:hypothetical protein